MTTLVLGPVRGGKSARAQALARASRKRVVCLVTAALDPDDPEMQDRIERHRRDRPTTWTVVETAVPGARPVAALLDEAGADVCILLDALGTWLAGQLLDWPNIDDDDAVAVLDELDARGTALADALARTRADAIVVAEETGWGVVPPTPLGRVFRDALGRLNQRIAAHADRVELVVAGYAVDLRAIGRPVEMV